MVNYLEPDFSDLPGRRALQKSYGISQKPIGSTDVSIVTPYYNTEEIFFETFVSLQAQSLQNWEWVIVDDGSTDQESVNRLSSVANQDPRIKVLRQANAGPGAARNTSFRNTTGRYLCLLDSDDMVEPTYLEKCVWFLDSNPEFAFCNSQSVVFGDQEYLWTTGFERGKAHLQANSGPPISVIRRTAYADCGGFDESIRFGHEDWDFWLAMAKAGHWGYTLPEFLQWYRKRGDGRFEQIMRAGDVNNQFFQTAQPLAYSQAVSTYNMPLNTMKSLYGIAAPGASAFQQTPTASMQPPNYMSAVNQDYQNKYQQFGDTMQGAGQLAGGVGRAASQMLPFLL